MKLIKETHTIGNDIYERNVGCRLNLHELIESAENYGLELDHNGECFVVGNPTEYEVFVSGKAVDSSKVTVVFYDTEDIKTDYYYCEATGDELSADTLEYAKDLMKMPKEELIQKLLND
jgi:hypothetical protein